VGGNTNGHSGGHVAWFDEYDPRTASWSTLDDAPHSRDHFHAAVVGDKLYAIGGRRTARNNVFNDTVKEVDVYEITNKTWITSNLPPDLPTPRAAAAVAVRQDRIMIMGGESGRPLLLTD